MSIPYINAAGSETINQKLDAELLGYFIGLGTKCYDDIPIIELKISYENIYGKKYVANIEIKTVSTYIRKNKGQEYLINFEISMEYQ